MQFLWIRQLLAVLKSMPHFCKLHGSPGTQIAAADADDQQHIGIAPDPLRGGLDAQHFLGGMLRRQIQPAQIVAARAGALHQGAVGLADLFFNAQ